MLLKISRSEIVPFLDSNGQVMTMRNFEINVEVQQEPHETLEQCEKQLEETFEKHRSIIAQKIPLLQTGSKRLNLLSEELRKKCTEQEFNKIISQIKLIK